MIYVMILALTLATFGRPAANDRPQRLSLDARALNEFGVSLIVSVVAVSILWAIGSWIGGRL